MKTYFGETLRSLRKEKGLTQEMLADIFSISFQTVSKWERNESYPDITMLPAIAAFFNVSVDSLLGINLMEKDRKIKYYCDEYSRLWSEHKIGEVKELMKKAVSEFPGNYDLLSKYLNALIQASSDDEYLIRIKPEVQKTYDIIQNYCTADSIRIWTKKIMCRYLRNISLIKNSGCSISEAEKILAEMPLMQNTRDYEAMFMYPHDAQKRSVACANGISEILYLFGEIVNRQYESPLDYDETVLKAFVDLLEAVMPDGDYGKSFHHAVYDSGYIGVKNYLSGNTDTALAYFEKCATLAAKYDALPETSQHTSFLLKGLEFNKSKMTLGTTRMSDRIKSVMLNRYPLSDEFKNSAEFRKILAILG